MCVCGCMFSQGNDFLNALELSKCGGLPGMRCGRWLRGTPKLHAWLMAAGGAACDKGMDSLGRFLCRVRFRDQDCSKLKATILQATPLAPTML